MKMKSVSGITFYVKDIDETTKFYEALGFTFRKKEPAHATAYLNWFWIDFLSKDTETRSAFREDARLNHKGAGAYIYISVDDVDGFYESILSEGLQPSTEPRNAPWGNREFVIQDPDGFNLTFFKRK